MKNFAQGFHTMSVATQEKGRGSIKIITKTRSGSGNAIDKTSFSTNEINFSKNIGHWVAKNVPAFRKEPYMASENNFISKINFELASTRFPNQPINRIMGTWNDINATFLKNHDFGVVLNTSGFLKNEVSAITSGSSSDQDKIENIINYVKEKITWNKVNTRYATQPLRATLNEGRGSSADINLLLTNMLRKAGYTADPVLISTRSHGFVREPFALSSQFNYVVSLIELGDRYLLLDATDKTLPYYLLPQRCLNGKGWRVSNTEPGWVELTSNGTENVSVVAELELDPLGKLKGKTGIEYSDYRAHNLRAQFTSKGDEFESYLAEVHEWEIEGLEIEGIKDLNAPVKLSFEMIKSNNVETLGDLIYLNPFVTGKIEKNPFQLESREYPVDFISPIKTSHVVSIKLPEGYEIEELPESVVYSLPSGAVEFTYEIEKDETTIKFKSVLNIVKPLFTGLDYPELRTFYIKVVEKQAEQIVLKKIN